jgi:putative DNA primase/helicase
MILNEAITKFQRAMVVAGIHGSSAIIADGRIHRFDVDGDKRGSRNGWYVLHPNSNEISAGAFGNWKTVQKEKWCSRMPDHITDDERQAWQRQIQEAKKQIKREVEAKQTEAASEAQTRWAELSEASSDHPYLQRKHIQPHGIRQEQDRLVIPVRDAKGELKSLQFIGPDKTKRFLIGGTILGHYHTIGTDPSTIRIIEGYSTGSTVYEAVGGLVVIAFNAGNLKPIAQAIRQQYPNANITIIADDDQWVDGNPGLTKAKAAAEAIRAKLVIPQFTRLDSKPTDFNDLYYLEGLDMVKKQLTEVLSIDGKEKPCAESPDEAIARLAALSSVEYGQQRARASKQLGVALKFLDQAVSAARTANGTNTKPGQGSEINFEEIFRSEEPVDGAALVESLTTIIERFMVLPTGAALTIALWILRTFIFDLFGINPILSIRSPVMQCGKTTLINLIAMFVPKAQTTSNATPASVFRLIEKYHQHYSWMKSTVSRTAMRNFGGYSIHATTNERRK